MAFQQSDLDRLDNAILSGVKRVEFEDGRKTEFHSLDEMRRLRSDIKTELHAQATQINPSRRTTRARVVRG